MHVKHLGNLLVAKPFNLSEHDNLAVRLWKSTQSGDNSFPKLRVSRTLKRGRIACCQRVGHAKGLALVILKLRVDGQFLPFMPAPPAALIARLMQRDPVNPGPEARVAMKARDITKDLNKHFLRHIRRIGRIAQAARHQGINWLTILSQQEGKRLLGSSLQFRDELLLVCTDSDRAC